jgi:hypothetical protein
MRIAGCSKLVLHPLTGNWFRALNLKHWNSRLRSEHSRTCRSRFSAASHASPLYRILYLGENHQVAIYEVGALPGRSERANFESDGVMGFDESACATV